jgi:hypothetical protein
MRFALVDCTQFVNLCYEDELYTCVLLFINLVCFVM